MKKRRITAALAATALAAAGWIGTTAPAYAHDTLTDSTPENNSVIGTMPDSLKLQFNEEVLSVGAEASLTDASGTTVTTGSPVINGTTVTVPVPGAATAAHGAYSFAWRVVSADGHPIDGTIVFTVGEASAGALASGATAGSESADAHSHTDGDADADTASSQAAQNDSANASTVSAAALWIGGGIAVALVVLLVVVVTRRRKQSTDK